MTEPELMGTEDLARDLLRRFDVAGFIGIAPASTTDPAPVARRMTARLRAVRCRHCQREVVLPPEWESFTQAGAFLYAAVGLTCEMLNVTQPADPEEEER